MRETPATEQRERDHSGIEWLELFFDLMGAAAVAVFIDGLLTGADLPSLGIFLVLFVTGWFAWTLVVMYADLAAEKTATRVVVTAMVLLGIMAATSPLHFTERANAFAIAFIVLRLTIAIGARHTGRRLIDDPLLLQAGTIAVPWLVSLSLATPAKYWLWGLGTLIDIGMLALQTGRPRHAERERPREGRSRPDRRERRLERWANQQAVGVDPEHLGERLGLLWLILLGTIASTLVLEAATTPWDRPFVTTAFGGFALLLLMFFLGFGGPPQLRPHNAFGRQSPRIGLSLHLVTMLAIALAAVGIGGAIREPTGTTVGLLRILLGVGLAGYIVGAGAGRAMASSSSRSPWPATAVGAIVCLSAAVTPLPGSAALGVSALGLAAALLTLPRPARDRP